MKIVDNCLVYEPSDFGPVDANDPCEYQELEICGEKYFRNVYPNERLSHWHAIYIDTALKPGFWVRCGTCHGSGFTLSSNNATIDATCTFCGHTAEIHSNDYVDLPEKYVVHPRPRGE